jgi:lycopene cyclase domain-containing protein
MTYFSVLIYFIGIPILLLAVAAGWDTRHARLLPPRLSAWNLWAAIALHVGVAVIYTTPWDNYLVATGVWYYDPALVTGIVIGWVPIEEYTFFVVQTILAGLWLSFLARRLALPETPARLAGSWRWLPSALLGGLWIGSVVTLVSGWQPGTYLGLELAWALPPIILQLAFGGDILRRYGRLVLAVIVPLVAYLCFLDTTAISSGTWTIAPSQSLGISLAGLPLEEAIFFLVTTTLVVFGVLLLISAEGQERGRTYLDRLRRRGTGQAPGRQPGKEGE